MDQIHRMHTAISSNLVFVFQSRSAPEGDTNERRPSTSSLSAAVNLHAIGQDFGGGRFGMGKRHIASRPSGRCLFSYTTSAS